jgi:uncharacterized protein YbjT (DUF2867 family)
MILVTGVTGLNGSAIVREFVREGHAVRALVRDRAKAEVLGFGPNVELVDGDMSKPETLSGAFDGVRRTLMISGADLKMAETQCTFIDAAKKAGVRHIVKFSGLGFWDPARASTFPFGKMHGDVEQYLERSGLEWTHLCPSQFMQVYFREAPTIASEGAIRLPLGGARLAPIDVEDIARIAFRVMTSEGHEGKRYEMTGPEALTMDQVAEALSQALGAEIRYVDISPEEKRKTLLAAGIPPSFADAMDHLFAARRAGHSKESTVNLMTHERFGVKPTTFFEFAGRNADLLRGRGAATHLWASGWQGARG